MSVTGGDALYAADRWAEVRALVDRLSEMPSHMQAAALEQVAAHDAGLANIVRALLDGTDDGSVAQMRSVLDRLLPSAGDAMPATVGPFRLLKELGAGGMGVVYLAERSGTDFSQRVALKLLDGDAARVSRLAARERRILAALTHPNVTAFVDAGDDHGRAWLAMEYVEGEPLRDYCVRHDLDARAQVRLFDQVCAAVAHAHLHLVVHRDLKPSNVLVTTEGAVKLLDFGIAVVLDPGGDQTPATRVFTPEYAAPEQLRGERATTATDVFGLGLMLYELVTGRRLPTLDHASNSEWTTAELANRANAPSVPDETSRKTPGEPRTSVSRLLRGDLGRIIAHALAPKPAQRYASVALLREDIARWLDHRPLTIGRPGAYYLITRFVRRHRVGTLAAAIATLSLVAGMAGIAWQARIAETQARRATAVKDFLLDIFKHNSIEHPDGAQARKTTAEQLLGFGAERIRTQLQDVPDVRAELLGTMGDLYAGLALDESAIPLYEEKMRVLATLPKSRANAASIAAAQVALGTALTDSGRTQDSTRILNEALKALDEQGDHTSITRAAAHCYQGENAYFLLPADDPTAAQQFAEGLRIVQTYHPESTLRTTATLGLARVAEYAGRLDEAEAYYRQALVYAQTPGDAHPLDAAGAQDQLGDLLRKRQRFEEAEAELRSAVAIYTQAAGADSPWTASAQQDLARLLAASGHRGDAERLLVDALHSLIKSRGADDKELVPHLQFDLGDLQFERGEWEAASESFKSCIANLPPEDNSYAVARARYGQILLAEGRLAEAAPLLDEAVAAIARISGKKSGGYARARLAQGELSFAKGDATAAQATFREVLADSSSTSDVVPPQYVRASLDLMELHIAAGQAADAISTGELLLKRVQSQPQGSLSSEYQAQTHFWLGEAQRLDGNPHAGLTHLQAAVTLREQLDDPMSPSLARARIALANCLFDLHRPGDAGLLLRAAASALAQHPYVARSYTASLALTQARARRANVDAERPSPRPFN